MRTSKIILCKNIKLDKEYKNVLSYTESDMLALCNANKITESTNFSFIKPNKNEIEVPFTYLQCLTANYIAFQNPTYANKWFFAFIDEIEYRNDSNTRIKFTVDVFSTWWDYWRPKACYVVREHVNDDTIGLHTYPENLETGEYVCNTYQEIGSFNQATSKVIVACTWLPSNTPGMNPYAQYYGGVFSGVYLMAFDYSNANKFIQALDGLDRGDAIQSVFMAPGSLCTPITSFTADIISKINNNDGTTSSHTFNITGGFIGNSAGNIIILQDKSISINTTLNGYSPRCNKLFTWPFNSLVIASSTGQVAEYHYEDFLNNTPIFNIQGTLCPGCDIKLYPENYKKIADSGAGSGLYPGFTYGLMASKFPICSWQNDAFVNWMTQESVNHKMGIISGIAKIGGMLLNSSEGIENTSKQYGSLIGQQINYMNEVYQHSLISPQQSGSINGSNVAFGLDEMNFSVYQMSIRYEYAKMCDDYLFKYGYRVNTIKIPNQLGRENFNYVQIGSSENIGYVENGITASEMEEINNIYRRGVTIWHNHTNLGDFSVSNDIIPITTP